MGLIFAPCIGTATLGVGRQEAGIASAMLNTSQQVGGSVGTALLSTLFASAASYATHHPRSAGLANAAAVHGYTTAFCWAAGIFGVGLLVALLIFPSPQSARHEAPRAEAGAAGELGVERA
jgi:sugar phosphate permease